VELKVQSSVKAGELKVQSSVEAGELKVQSSAKAGELTVQLKYNFNPVRGLGTGGSFPLEVQEQSFGNERFREIRGS
jgi:hypothetical protein